MPRPGPQHWAASLSVGLTLCIFTGFTSQGPFGLSSFPCGSAGKESACNAGDPGLIPGLGRSPGEGKGYPLQYSGLENSMDCIDGVTKGQTQLSDFHFHFLPKMKRKYTFPLEAAAWNTLTALPVAIFPSQCPGFPPAAWTPARLPAALH